MATIRQYDNGRWQAIIRRKQQPTLSKMSLTKQDADKWARLTQSEIDRGIF